jgi:hypothetical protein
MVLTRQEFMERRALCPKCGGSVAKKNRSFEVKHNMDRKCRWCGHEWKE